MSVDQLQREQELIHLPASWPATQSAGLRPRLAPLLVSLVVSLLMWAGMIFLVRWALPTV